MELLGALIFFLIMGAVALAALSALLRRLNRWNRIYEKVNKRYCGQLFRGYMVSSPRLWFNYGRTNARVQNRRSFGYPSRRTTELWLHWPDRRMLRFEIARKRDDSGMVRPSRMPSKMYQMDTGNEEFDNNFLVHCNQPDMLKPLLTNQVLWQIKQLDVHGNGQPIQVSLRRGTLRIVKPGWMRSAEDLDDYIRFGLELFDRIQLEECEGIDFKNGESVAVVDNAICPICSEKIVDQLVVCLRCKTPHCMDCWQYNGQCATFACEEKRYVKG